MAKPSLLRKSVIQKIAHTVGRGVPLKQAAIGAGVSPRQVTTWMKTGGEMRSIVEEKGSFPKGSTQEDWLAAELHQEVEKAHAAVVERYVGKINAAAKKSWLAAAWWLQRRAKEDFSPAPEKADAKPDEDPNREQFVFHCPENGRGK